MSSSNAEFHPLRFFKTNITFSGTKVPRVSLYGVVKNKQLVAFTDSESLICPMLKFCERPAQLPLHANVYSDLCLCLGSLTLQDLFQVSKYLLLREKIRNFLSERFPLLACVRARLSLELFTSSR